MMAYGHSYDYLFRLQLVGDSNVGKTALFYRFAGDIFNYSPPWGFGEDNDHMCDFKTRTMEVDDKTVKLQVWDTAGQERFRSISSPYYKRSAGVLLVYDIATEESFGSLGTWLREIKEQTSDNVQVMILGNKSDLTETRQVSSERGRMFAEEHGLKFMETSAKTGENVELAFMTLAKDVTYAKELRNDPVRIDAVSVRHDSSNGTSSTSGCF